MPPSANLLGRIHEQQKRNHHPPRLRDAGARCRRRNGAPNAKERFVKSLYDRLLAEGWEGLVFLPGAGMYADDSDGTVDGCHPNDHGMVSLAQAYGAAVATALGRDGL